MKLKDIQRLSEAAIKNDQIPRIIEALVKAGAFKADGVEWVGDDDDGRSVKGPDGVEGWFNDSKFDRAVKEFDPATVRKAVGFFWLIERLQRGYVMSAADEKFFKAAIPLLGDDVE